MFSRLAPWKGQHVLLRTLARLPQVRCVVVGDALFGEQAYAQSLRNLTDELGLADRVMFLGHRTDLPQLMRAVDIMVHPSIAPEPFGRTLVEAMIVGVPVIATNIGAPPEILDGGAAGTLVPPEDDKALADAIDHVLTHRTEIDAQVDYAAARAHLHYDAAKMIDAISDLIGRTAIESRP